MRTLQTDTQLRKVWSDSKPVPCGNVVASVGMKRRTSVKRNWNAKQQIQTCKCICCCSKCWRAVEGNGVSDM